MSRSIWKGPFSECIPSQKVVPSKQSFKNRIWSRRSMILPVHVGKEFLVHNGKNFVPVKCLQEMCSRKFGEFAATRKKPSHKLNKRKQLHKKKK